MTNVEQFRALGIGEETLKMLEQKGFEIPSPIQEKVIPLLLAGDKNIIGQAQTGTGKTAAFGIPLAEKILKHEDHTQAIIMAPTRELAIQVADEIRSFLHNKNINVVTIYGGQSYEIQLKALKKGADIIVGTPGRLIDHLNRKRIRLDKIKYMILDEADEMLNMGFIDDIKEILNHTNDTKSTMLFSATMPREIINVAKKYMGDYEIVAVKKEQLSCTQTDQLYFNVNFKDKLEALCRVMDIEKDFFGIVFCKTRADVDDVTAQLTHKGYSVDGLHGEVAQNQRERIINKFKAKKTNVLIATDVAARGIDVNDITHVINYSLPQNPDAYIHRVGRTGRAGKTGTAITFVTPSEAKRLPFFKRATNTDIKLEKIPNIESVLSSKKSQIIGEVVAAIDNESYKKQLDLAKEILENNNPHETVAALLELKYENELCATKYREITEAKPGRGGSGRSSGGRSNYKGSRNSGNRSDKSRSDKNRSSNRRSIGNRSNNDSGASRSPNRDRNSSKSRNSSSQRRRRD